MFKSFIVIFTNGDLPTNPMSLRECMVCGKVFTRKQATTKLVVGQKERQEMSTNPSKRTLKVIVEQAEGLSADCVPQTYEGPDCVERANQYLCRIAANCPDLGYDVTITVVDGTDYTFRFEKTTSPTVWTIRVCPSDKHKLLGPLWYVNLTTKQPVVEMCDFLGSLPTPEQMAKRREEEAKTKTKRMMDAKNLKSIHAEHLVTGTTKLKVGQSVFMSSGAALWGIVVKITPTGVVVQADPNEYGDELMRFDKNGAACDSSDIDVEGYKDLVLYDGDHIPRYDLVDVGKVKAVASQYVEGTRFIPRAASGDVRKFRQHFWENFECQKRHSRYDKIPSTDWGPLKLYLHP